MLGLANGSASTTEINNALNNVNPDPDDATSYAIAANKKLILYQSLLMLDGRADVVTRMETRIGSPGKGIPLNEDTGIQLFAFNYDSAALTTGASVKGMYTLEGVWLND